MPYRGRQIRFAFDRLAGRYIGCLKSPGPPKKIRAHLPMKTGIHPQLYDTHVTCSCGNSFLTRATVERLQLDICSNCHPFFTGTQKLVDTQGQVERFQQRLNKSGSRGGSPGDRRSDQTEDDPESSVVVDVATS